MKKVLKVKGLEVEVVGDVLRFEKDGEMVEVKREIGKSDYSVVYLELVRKGEKRSNDGWKKLGRFEYKVENDLMSIRRVESLEMLVEDKEVSEENTKYIRTYVTNLLLEIL